MNIIVTNKYRDLIYSTNIEVLKELNGVYKTLQLLGISLQPQQKKAAV